MGDWFYFIYFGSILIVMIVGIVAAIFSPLMENSSDWMYGNFWTNCGDTIRWTLGENVVE